MRIWVRLSWSELRLSRLSNGARFAVSVRVRRAPSRYTALAEGWPIATGVIEGACRHLVKDRFDITGARWSLDGAEAILKLRALTANGDFDDYWVYHLRKEHERIHQSRYGLAA